MLKYLKQMFFSWLENKLSFICCTGWITFLLWSVTSTKVLCERDFWALGSLRGQYFVPKEFSFGSLFSISTLLSSSSSSFPLTQIACEQITFEQKNGVLKGNHVIQLSCLQPPEWQTQWDRCPVPPRKRRLQSQFRFNWLLENSVWKEALGMPLPQWRVQMELTAYWGRSGRKNTLLVLELLVWYKEQ